MLVGIAVLCVLEEVVWRESDANTISPNSIAHFSNDFEHESTAIFNRTSILVSPRVDVVV